VTPSSGGATRLGRTAGRTPADFRLIFAYTHGGPPTVKSPRFPLFPELAGRPTLREVGDAVRAAGLDGLPAARRRADDARYQEVHVRSALTRTMGMPFRWALNP